MAMNSPRNIYIKNQFAPLTLRQKLGILTRARTFAGPVYAQIGVTDRCNMRCLCCWFYSPLVQNNPYREKAAELPYEDYRRLLTELYGLGCRYIIIVGFGEPFVHPRIMDMLADAKRMGFNAGVCTNGTLLTDATLDALIGMRLDRIDVSVWAGSSGSYLKTHQGCSPKTFDRIRTALLRIRDLKRSQNLVVPYVKILNVISRANCTDIAEMIDFGIEVGAEEITFTPVMTASAQTNTLLLTNAEAARVREDLEKLREKVGESSLQFVNINEYLERISSERQATGDYDLGRIHRIPCTIGWRFLVTLTNGDVLACCNGEGRPMGNFLRQSMQEIWEGATYREFRRRAVVSPRCADDKYFLPFCCGTRCPHYLECLDVYQELSRMPGWKKSLMKAMGGLLPG